MKYECTTHRLIFGLAIALCFPTACFADAVVFRALYERFPGSDPISLRGVALLNGDAVYSARLKWHGPNWEMVATGGTWDGTALFLEGAGCVVDNYPSACRPHVPMVYSSEEGLMADDDPVQWEMTSPFIVHQGPVGDANLDGVFNSSDFVQVMRGGIYDDNSRTNGIRNADWGTGDWNLDLEFDSSDLVFALQEGAYQAAARAVPEPSALLLACLLLWPLRRVPARPVR